MLITTDGLIARLRPVGDCDQLVDIITPTRGRLTVLVKHGQQNLYSQAAIIQLFTYGNFELYRKRDRYWLRSGSSTDSFYNLTCHLEDMALGAYLCDLSCDLTGEGEGEEDIQNTAVLLRMLLNSLYAIGIGTPRAIVKGVFELRAAAGAGYTPHLLGCALCHNVYPESGYLDVMNGRIICADCQAKLNRLGGRISALQEESLGERRILVPMSSSVLAAVRYALTAPDKKIFSFVLKDREEELAFGRVAETFLLNHLERGFDTLDFYHSLMV